MRRAGAALGLALALVGCRPAPSVTPEVAAGGHATAGEGATATAGVDPAAREALRALLSRVGFVGASASAGFGESVALVDAFDHALVLPHEAYDVSTSAFFMRVDDIARLQIEAMRARKPSMVFAVDFLFWFAHGDKDDATRHADLQTGMAMLEELGVPVFVGDLPDVHGASRRMIGPSHIPSASQLAALNASIAAWAEAHDSIHLVPMSTWMAALKLETTVQVWDAPYQPRAGRVLQWDLLHPSREGQAVLALLLLGLIREQYGGFVDGDVVSDPTRITSELHPRSDGAPRELPPPPG